MKKNISINLFGTLYNIDEDAYNLMESYLQSMQRYFSRQEGGEEVADDIEHRVAELLWQRREAGMTAINIETVREIIDTIGNAEQIACDSGEEQGSPTEGQDATFKESFSQFTKEAERFTRDTYDRGRNHVNTHHFYRCMDDKVLGGVCSGAAAYFNSGDPLVWRLSAVLGTLLLSLVGIGLFIPIIYIVLWLLAPVAITPEDRLRMQGKEITPENLAQQVKEESQRPIVVQNNDGCAGGCLKVLLVFIGMIVLFPFIISAIALVFGIVVVAGVGTAMVGGIFGSMQFFPEFSAFVGTCQPLFLTALICGLIVVVLPIYGIIRLLRGGKKMRASVLTTLIVVWLLAIGLGIACSVGTAIKAEEWDRSGRDEIEFKQSVKELKFVCWELKEHKNLDEEFSNHCTGFGGLPRYAIRLEPDKNSDITFTAVLEKEVNLPEEGAYQFVSLTEGYDAGLTYTFSYMDGGKDKEAVLHPSDSGIHLNSISWEDLMQNYTSVFPFLDREDEGGWYHFSRDEEDWVYQCVDLPHVDAGKFNITISARDCSERIKIREVNVVKRNEQLPSPSDKPTSSEEKKTKTK